MADSVHTLAALRRHIAMLDRKPASDGHARFAIGHESMDRTLDGGLGRGRVHELFGTAEEEGAASGFALLLARLASDDAPLLWLRTHAASRAGGAPYGPGLAALGLDPARLLIGVLADDAMLLRAAVEALRCPALGALVIELRGRAPLLDLTASRRMALAAEASGVTALLLRIGGDPVPSAAETRWRVEAAPSLPLREDPSGRIPGMSAFALTLLRRRAGRDGLEWRLVWDSEKGGFEEIAGDRRHERDGDGRAIGGADSALSGALVSLPPDRPAAGHAA